MPQKFFRRAVQYQPLAKIAGVKRILVVGEFWQGANGRGYARAFRQLGLDVVELDVNHFLPLFMSRAGRLIARIMSGQFHRNLNRRILNEATLFNVDYVIFIKGIHVSQNTISSLRIKNIKTILFYPDVLFDHSGVSEYIAAENDFIFSTKKFHVDHFNNKFDRAVYHLDHGFYDFRQSGHPAALNEQDYDWDLCYVGNANQYKYEWMEKVALAFPSIKMIIVGNGWTKLAAGRPLEKFVLGYPVSGDRLGRYIARSRINLAFHFGPIGEHQWQDDVSLRSFQIPANGGFMLHIDSDEIRSLYKVPDEIDVFDSPETLCEKIAFYLANPAVREAMTDRARTRCRKDYHLVARAGTILSVLQGHPV